MSKFTDERDAVEKFISNGFHAFWHGVQPAVVQATPAVEKALLSIATTTAAAALQAQGSGADGKAVFDASLKAGLGSAKEQEAPLVSAGITIGVQQIGALAGAMTAHVAPSAPPPPAT
jgi:hypothetical protein